MSPSPEAAPPPGLPCPSCGTELTATALACPACGTLVHAARLKQLVAEAEAAAARGEGAVALATWRRAQELLPPTSQQYLTVGQRIAALAQRVPDSALAEARARAGEQGPSWARRAGPLGAIGLLVWKLKWVAALVLAQGKLLVAGLAKGGTFWSMLLALGVYFSAFGWRFGLGFVLLLYVHEMGHVAALRRFGIAASPPMFIPGLGALVRLKQYPQSPVEDARCGLAGPVWGLAGAAACWLVFLASGAPLFAALARAGGWLNLFNLLPVWQLDGARGLHALDRGQRFGLAFAMAAVWALGGGGLVALLAVVTALRAAGKDAPAKGDGTALWTFLVLVVALGYLAQLDVPGGPLPNP